MFKKGLLVRCKVSGRLFRVVGASSHDVRWVLQEMRTGDMYFVKSAAARAFTLIGNNYKAKG